MEHRAQMLHDFLSTNRNELIKRCKAKVAKRSPTIPAAIPSIADKGVPLFLAQLVDTLRREQLTPTHKPPEPEPTPAPTEIGHAAALHGAELLRLGYTVDQVVHEYGDVCQSVTDMVVEQNASFAPDEFRTLNGCLDNAIADAVTAYTDGHNTSTSDDAKTLRQNAGSLADEEKRLVDIAIQTYTALQVGSVALNGATGTVLRRTLGDLRGLIEQAQLDNHPLSARSPVLQMPRKGAAPK